MDSVFRVLEPISAEINEGRLNPHDLQPSPLRWFRIYRVRVKPILPPPSVILSLTSTVQKDFFLPKEAHNVVFLKARIAILCRKGFEIMDITESESTFSCTRPVSY